MFSSESIAITGLGVISAAGTGSKAMWDKLVYGKPLAGRANRLDYSKYPSDLVVEMPKEVMDILDKNMDPCATLTWEVCRQAIEDAGEILSCYDPERIGLIIGTTTAGWTKGEEFYKDRAKSALPAPLTILNTSLLSVAAEKLGIYGPSAVVSSACASSLQAIGFAMDRLRNNEADMMLVGGVDVLAEYPFCGFSSLRLAGRELCHPFSKDRGSMVLGEGAAVIVLERLRAAVGRGAKLHGIIRGYGESCDANSMSTPCYEGIARAMRSALVDAGIEEVDAIFAHGTGTQVNDAEEAKAICSVFEAFTSLPITSIKGVLGHTQAAAGIFNVAAGIMALESGLIPPIAGFTERDPELPPVDLVIREPRKVRFSSFIASAFGFGGVNASIIISDGSFQNVKS